MDIKIVKMIHQSIANVIKTYGFTGDIEVNLLHEEYYKNNRYFGVYYFYMKMKSIIS